MSGVAALSLLKSETAFLSHHYKTTLEGLLKIHNRTPEPFVFFIAGSLPFQALLHLRQLGLFGMICRAEENILHDLAKQILTSSPENSHSWFVKIKDI